MIESDIGKKNAQRVTINITILEFPVIPGYGTKPDIFVCPFLPQYIEPSPLNLHIGPKSHGDLNQPIKILRKRNT
jgi:hypothetical protein